MALNAWHQDQVVEVPEGAEVVATSPFCENAALVYGDRAFTVQAHPEFSNAFTADMIERRGPRPRARPAPRRGQGDGWSSRSRTRLLADRIARFFHERVAA